MSRERFRGTAKPESSVHPGGLDPGFRRDDKLAVSQFCNARWYPTGDIENAAARDIRCVLCLSSVRCATRRGLLYFQTGGPHESTRSVLARDRRPRGRDVRGAGARRNAGQAAQHHHDHGRRHRLVQHRRLQPGHHGGQDAEPRPAGGRGHALHRLLRRGELHGGARQLHHRRAADPHGPDDGRPGRFADRHAGAGADHRHGAEGDGLRHRPVRQEPPGRPEPVPAHGARLRRVLRLPLSPRRDGGPLPSATTRKRSRRRSARATWSIRWATNVDDPTVQPRWGKIGKQKIEDAGELCPKRMETVDDEILDNALKFIDKAQQGRQAVLPLAQSHADARRHAPVGEVRRDAQLGERLVHPGSRHGAARRHRRRGDEIREGRGPRRRHHHRLHAPTTAPRTSPGPTAARRRSPAARGRRSKAVSACR